ncbi:pas domain s-box protein [Stylonychia lemnae]|uniref:Pas domain s-box protein n=1 Tax=Stylonychia lemnae TaxID=5949 RepID=A0A078AQG3_STYLE|nr:pas domain s-box protein [Stylonychia lemnae]|eukprot:CDW84389.1 pas domain s-box protein [Stylonychia lemnae]
MDSKFTLRIKDPQIRLQYQIERDLDIRFMCKVTYFIRIFFAMQQHINGLQHSASIKVLSLFRYSFANYSSQTNDLVNKKSSAIQVLQFCTLFKVCYLAITGCIATGTLLLIYTCYFHELRLKQSFIQLRQIQLMNEDMRKLLDNLPEGIVLFDPETKKITLVNQEYKRLFSLSGDEYNNDPNLLLTKYSLTDKKDQFKIMEKMKIIAFKQSIKRVMKITSFSNLMNLRVVVVTKQLVLAIKYEKLKIENHFYEMLTATVSHDMRTPLNIIGGLLNNLDEFITKETGKRFLRIIKNSSKFMCFLVNDLLDLFQIKNGKFNKNLAWVDLKSSILELIDIFSIGSNEKGIQVICEFDSNFPQELYLDDQRIKQVLLNLLQNSLKFTYEGQIKVEAKYDYRQSKLEISVSDTGIGIKPEDRNKLFTLFGKLEATAEINTSGVGLGLSICKKIISMFEGQIILDKDYSQGCRFIFSIEAPTTQKQKKQIKNDQIQQDSLFQSNLKLRYLNTEIEERNISLHQGNLEFQSLITQSIYLEDIKVPISDEPIFMTDQMRGQCSCERLCDILIVDDNVFNLVTLEAILELQFKLKVDKASNGIEAVQKVKQRLAMRNNLIQCCQRQKCLRYKLIFMDCNMPLMDGFQATQQIRLLESEYDQNLRSYIAALTAYSTEGFQKKCFAASMDCYITKPVSVEQLSIILKEILGL